MKHMAWMLLFISVNAFALNLFPDVVKTPGTRCMPFGPDFREFRYRERVAICWRRVSQSKRNLVYSLYNVPEIDRDKYTIDHLIPLSLGGGNEIQNLWPQPKILSTARIEQRFYFQLLQGRISHAESVWMINEIKRKK